MLDLSVVVPSYLEEENLRNIIPRIDNVLRNMEIEYEILIIDTCEPMDKTFNICRRYSHVKYINRIPENVYGDAVRTGIREENAKWVLFMDADGSHTPEFIPNLFKKRLNYDVVIASRYTKGGGTDNNQVLVIMSKILNIIFCTVLNIKCKDISNSYKLYRADFLKKVKLNCSNFDIVEEMFFKLSKMNRKLRVLEVPYVFKERMFGRTKRKLMVFMLSFGFTLFKFRFGICGK